MSLEGAEPNPNGGEIDEGEEGTKVDEGEEGRKVDEGSEEEDIGLDEGDEGEVKVKIEEVSDESEDEEYEGFVKTLPNPTLPTQQMIDMRMVSHLPYANWCPHCVRGRGARYAHKQVKDRDDQVPVICGDYCIYEEHMTMLVMIDRRTKFIFAHILAQAVPADSFV